MSRVSEAALSELILAIHSAALTDEWGGVLAKISATLCDSPVQLFGHNAFTATPAFMHTAGHEPGALEAYVEHFHEKNVWRPEIERSKPGVVRSTDDYLSRDELIRSEYYNDWVKPNGDIGVGIGLVLYSDADRFIAFGTMCRDMDRLGLFGDMYDCSARLSSHLRLAIETQRLVAGARMTEELGRIGFERTGRPVFVATPDRTIIEMNGEAEALLAAGVVVHLDRNGKLRARDAVGDLALGGALRSVPRSFERLSAADESQSQPFMLCERGASEAVFAKVAPFVPPAPELGRFADPTLRAPSALLTLSSNASGKIPEVAGIATAFGLTAAEALLAQELCLGRSLVEIAERRGVSIHTVRTQCKTLLAKTGAGSQTRLVAMVYQADL